MFSSKGKDVSPSGTLKITNLSDKLDNMAGAVKSLTLNKNERKKLLKEKKKNLKAKKIHKRQRERDVGEMPDSINKL